MSNYPLKGVVRYFRKPTAGTLLYTLFQHVSKREHAGENFEFAQLFFTREGYVGVTFMAPPEDTTEDKT